MAGHHRQTTSHRLKKEFLASHASRPSFWLADLHRIGKEFLPGAWVGQRQRLHWEVPHNMGSSSQKFHAWSTTCTTWRQTSCSQGLLSPELTCCFITLWWEGFVSPLACRSFLRLSVIITFSFSLMAFPIFPFIIKVTFPFGLNSCTALWYHLVCKHACAHAHTPLVWRVLIPNSY